MEFPFHHISFEPEHEGMFVHATACFRVIDSEYTVSINDKED